MRRRSATLRGVIVHTVGHSTLPLDDFLALLAAHAHRRRSPTCDASRRRAAIRTSRREALAAALAARGHRLRLAPGARRPPSPRGPTRRTSPGGTRPSAPTPTTWTATEFRAGLDALLALARERADRRPLRRGRAVALPPPAHRRRAGRRAASRCCHVLGPAPADAASPDARSPGSTASASCTTAASSRADARRLRRGFRAGAIGHNRRPAHAATRVHIVSHGPHCLDGVGGGGRRRALPRAAAPRSRRASPATARSTASCAALAPEPGRATRALDHRHLVARAGDRRAPARARRARASASTGSTITGRRSSASRAGRVDVPVRGPRAERGVRRLAPHLRVSRGRLRPRARRAALRGARAARRHGRRQRPLAASRPRLARARLDGARARRRTPTTELLGDRRAGHLHARACARRARASRRRSRAASRSRDGEPGRATRRRRDARRRRVRRTSERDRRRLGQGDARTPCSRSTTPRAWR